MIRRILELGGSLLFKLGLVLRAEKRHRYEYFFDTGGATAPACVVRMVGKNRKALELGAGPGSISRVLVEQQGCDVTAAEYDESALEKLRTFCNHAFSVDLNSDSWVATLASRAPYEVIVIADVLEHLYDPWKTLSRAKALLQQGGEIVISLPHVGHNAIVACLLNGNFRYYQYGLLDSTHIRFFGLHNISALVEGAGLKIVDVDFVITPPEKTELADQWQALPEPTREALRGNIYGSVYQVVFKAIVADNGEDRGIDLLSALQARLAPDIQAQAR